MTKSSHSSFSQYLLQGAGLPYYFFISDSLSLHVRLGYFSTTDAELLPVSYSEP